MITSITIVQPNTAYPLNIMDVMLYGLSSQITPSSLTFASSSIFAGSYTGATYGPAYLANDGDLTTFLHTNVGDNLPTLTISLGSPQLVASITVYNRVDCCSYRMNGAVVTAYSGAAAVWSTVVPATAAPMYQFMVLPMLTHRYSFNDGTASDSVGGSTFSATLVNGAYVSSGQVVIQSSNINTLSVYAPYVSLPNTVFGLYSQISIEAWVTTWANAGYARIFQFGQTLGTNTNSILVYRNPSSGYLYGCLNVNGVEYYVGSSIHFDYSSGLSHDPLR